MDSMNEAYNELVRQMEAAKREIKKLKSENWQLKRERDELEKERNGLKKWCEELIAATNSE